MSKGLIRLAVSITIFIATILALGRLANPTDILRLAWQGSLGFLILATIAHIAYLFFQARLIGSLFALIDHSFLVVELIIFYIAAEFANFILPTGGLSGLTVFAAEAKKHDIAYSKALTISALSYYINYLTFGFILGLGLIILASHDQLNPSYVIPSIIMGGIILVGSVVVWTASKGPLGLKKIFKLALWLINHVSFRLRKKQLLSHQKIHALSNGIHATVTDLLDEPQFLWRPLAWGLLIHGSNIASLGLVFSAFHYPINLGVIIAGYAIGWLATIVSITPSGVGFVEGAMTLVFRSLGVPIEVAVLVTTFYRAIVFWLPFAFGALAFRRLKIFEAE